MSKSLFSTLLVGFLALSLFACSQPPPPPIETIRSVRTITVSERASGKLRRFSGVVEAASTSSLSFEVPGNVREVLVEVGERISQGQVLARLDTRDFTLNVEAAQANMGQAEVNLADAEREYARLQSFVARDPGFVSRQAMDQARVNVDAAVQQVSYTRTRLGMAERDLQRTDLLAPFDGVTDLRLVAPGDRVTPEIGLVSIAAVDRLQLIFAVQEMGVALARTGAVIHARVVAWPGERFRGEVFFVSPNVDPATRRLVLKAWVENPDHRLKPGMFANVDIEISRKENAVVVPETALVYDRNGTYVWRLTEESTAEKIPVDIGLRKDGQVEILRGVGAGDQVVSAGTHKVMAGKELRIAPLPPTEHARDGCPQQLERVEPVDRKRQRQVVDSVQRVGGEQGELGVGRGRHRQVEIERVVRIGPVQRRGEQRARKRQGPQPSVRRSTGCAPHHFQAPLAHERRCQQRDRNDPEWAGVPDPVEERDGAERDEDARDAPSRIRDLRLPGFPGCRGHGGRRRPGFGCAR